MRALVLLLTQSCNDYIIPQKEKTRRGRRVKNDWVDCTMSVSIIYDGHVCFGRGQFEKIILIAKKKNVVITARRSIDKNIISLLFLST